MCMQSRPACKLHVILKKCFESILYPARTTGKQCSKKRETFCFSRSTERSTLPTFTYIAFTALFPASMAVCQVLIVTVFIIIVNSFHELFSCARVRTTDDLEP